MALHQKAGRLARALRFQRRRDGHRSPPARVSGRRALHGQDIFEPLEARVLLSTVTGVVWFDVNFNGSIQAGESGLGGFTVFHDANANGQLNTGEASTTTDINGNYSLTGLPNNQTLRIAQVVPADWAQTAPGAPSFARLVNPGSGTASNVNFGAVRTATVTGTVFRDSDGDGVRDAGESGLNGWTMQLVDPANGQVVATATTSTQNIGNGSQAGAFRFDDLLPKSYLLREVVQNGWVQTKPGTPNFSHEVTLISGQILEAEGFAFGNVQAASVSGTVWSDADSDGVQDAGEPGLANWEVYADKNNNGVWDDVTTQAATRSYGGAAISIPDSSVGDPITPSINVSGLPGYVTDVNVRLNIQHTFNADLEVFIVSPSGRRVELFTDVGADSNHFTNTVLDDDATNSIVNGSGPFNGTFRPEGDLDDYFGEVPNGMWKLEIVDDLLQETGTFQSFSLDFTLEIPAEPRTTTNSGGAYTLGGLLPGSTRIRQTVESGFTATFPSGGSHLIGLSEGQNVTNRNFGNSGEASGASLDIDANGGASSDTDGILMVRHMIGFTGTNLVSGALGSGAQRTTASAIQSYLQDNAAMLDVDGNGSASADTDGILIVRYLIGFTGSNLTTGAIGSGATRTTASAVTAFLNQFNPASGAPAAPLALTAESSEATVPTPDDDGTRDAMASYWTIDRARLRPVEHDASSADDAFSLDDDAESPVWADWVA